MALITSAGVQDRDGGYQLVESGRVRYPSLQTIFIDSAYAGTCKQRLEADHEGLRKDVVRHPADRTMGRLAPAGQHVLAFDLPPRGAFVQHPERGVVERTNAWNVRPRRLVTDQDRSGEGATAWFWLAETRRMARRLAGGES